MRLGFIGLGKMGSRMVEKLLREGHQVNAWNRSKDVSEQFHTLMREQGLASNLAISYSIPSLVEGLKKPRVIWSMLPAGEPTESIFDELGSLVDIEAGDILIDGGNSYYKDTQRRYDTFQKRGIRFLGIGVSGGVIAAQNGYPLMVGGDALAYEEVNPILDSLAIPNGAHAYVGEGGAGHYVKMVHNAIEYGYMQAIGEGFGVLAKASYNFDLQQVAKLYQKGTLISGFMMDRTVNALEKDPKLSEIVGVIGRASEETVWTLEEAKKSGLPIKIIEESLEFRKQSETDPNIQNSFAAKMVASLRAEFGGHKVRKKQ